MIGIYKITSPTGKIYIGESKNVEKRKLAYRRNDCKNQRILYRSIKKHGWSSHLFEVIEECSIKDLMTRERFYQDRYDAVGVNGLNCKLTDTSEKKGVMSYETKIRIGIGNSGKVRTQEAKDRISNSLKGNVLSKEIKDKISETNSEAIIQLTKEGVFVKEWKGMMEASRSGFHCGHISEVCNKKRKSHKGFSWIKKEEYYE